MAEFYGTKDRDIIVGTDDDDFIWGGAGGDTLRGGLGNDQIDGEAGNDSLDGGAGHDTLRGGAGFDRLDGGAGTDTAIYGGVQSHYQIRTVNGSTIVRDLRTLPNGGEGTDTLVGVERIRLGDGTIIFLTPNQGPAAADDSFSLAEDGTASGNLFGNDSDADGDSFSVSAVNGDAAMVGNQITLASGALLTLNRDGSYTYDANGAFESLDDGETGSDSFQYTIDDGFGGTSTATVTITVTGADDQPTITAIDAGRASEDADPITIDLVATASDVDGDTVNLVSGSIALSSSNPGRTLSVTVVGDSLVFDPAQFNDLDEGESETITVTYSVTDGDGDAVVNTATLVVTGADDQPTAPVDINPADNELAEDAAVGTLTGITASATDPDDAIEYYFRDGDGNRVQTLGNFNIDTVTGVVTLAAALDYEETDSHTLTIYAGDGTAESSSGFTVAVSNVAPTITAGTHINLREDSNTRVSTASLTLSDPNGPRPTYETTGWTLVSTGIYRQDGNFGYATLNTVENTITYTLSNTYSSTNALNTGDTVSDDFLIQVSDGTGTSQTVIDFTIHGSDEKSILILYSDFGPPNGLINNLAAMGFAQITAVNTMNGPASAYSLSALSGYDVVFAFTNYSPPYGLGNTLADYVDGGGELIVSTYGLSNGWAYWGRLATDGYLPLEPTYSLGVVSGRLEATDPFNPIFENMALSSFFYPYNHNYADPALDAGATLLATDGAGVNMIAQNADGNIIAINIWPSYAQYNAQYVQLIANSIWVLDGVG